ncbi:1471_t:CDS:2 [Cetraspora pellucida]|uniref:1471_t:CDS:1 n=1 Tax=Cetraspora pellucida TaxID=1433469 RepID=A0A9N9C1K6_9GLOM|nr:1471_t:CDS:2 [Cetraspora pellucida]
MKIVEKQLCYPYYHEIVEPDCYNKSSINNNGQDHMIVRKPLSFGEKITLMTKVLYKKQREENNTLELNSDYFQTMLEDAEPQLVEFFDELYNAFIPERQSVYNRKEDKKK